MAQRNAGPLRSQRLRLGLTLENLAAQCAGRGAPVHSSQLSRIERGIYIPRPRLRAVLAGILAVDTDDFDGQPTEEASK
ncbi:MULTISPECIES: helix-turn-helix transcriptional regulator [unclassified Streptomyces]|uniref:helix-turn-helix domain-containing protein n=1 Tax=unclassified Streptomyces TaxID=2593676 RepID=UPI003441DF5A